MITKKSITNTIILAIIFAPFSSTSFAMLPDNPRLLIIHAPPQTKNIEIVNTLTNAFVDDFDVIASEFIVQSDDKMKNLRELMNVNGADVVVLYSLNKSILSLRVISASGSTICIKSINMDAYRAAWDIGNVGDTIDQWWGTMITKEHVASLKRSGGGRYQER